MSYEGVLSTFGLSHHQVQLMLVCGAILTVIGFILVMYWRFIVAGLVVFGVMTIFLHHPDNTTQPVEVVVNTPTSPPSTPQTDENMQKTSFVDPFIIFNAFVKMKELMETKDNVQPEPPKVAEVVIEPKQVVETEEMKEYISNCTELTRNADLCRETWITMKEAGTELILEPVERSVRRQIRLAKVDNSTKVNKPVSKVQEVKPLEVNKPISKVQEVKLLEVDNVEYKERRAAALSKPNAVVMQETYR